MLNKTSVYSISNTAVKILLLSAATVLPSWAQDHIVPPMVNIPTGKFMMGSESGTASAKPMHSVSIRAFQMAKYPVTVVEFRKFAEETGFNPKAECLDKLDKNWLSGPTDKGTASWDKHRYTNSEYQPVTCMLRQDANAYANWLSEKTGIQYRLPTEQEWEYSAKANTTSRFFWGDDTNMTQACLYGNFADQSGEYIASKQYGASYVGFLEYANCDDGEAYHSIVGLYRPNTFGLYDMDGNVSQHLNTCYYEDGYKKRSKDEMDLSKCEFTATRGNTWHYPPQPLATRGRNKKSWKPFADSGFRLAADGHNDKIATSTATFETALKSAQKQRLATRPKLVSVPNSLQLVKSKDNKNNNIYTLSWQPDNDPRVEGYEIYQSISPYAHLNTGFYQDYYQKVQTVNATQNSIKLSLPDEGGSFRVVTKTSKLTSLPSQPAVIVKSKMVDIPGRINMQDTIALENVLLTYRKAKEDKPEVFYLSKLNTGPEQPLVTSTFNINVKSSGWYHLNYRGNSFHSRTFFKLWQNNTLVGEINHDPNIDDKSSNRHKVFLEQGTHTMQLSFMHEGFDYWSMTWLEFIRIEG
jgi:formylglycine-generating enzyme required for sulfatase activity